jgi:hypothetical protein
MVRGISMPRHLQFDPGDQVALAQPGADHEGRDKHDPAYHHAGGHRPPIATATVTRTICEAATVMMLARWTGAAVGADMK